MYACVLMHFFKAKFRISVTLLLDMCRRLKFVQEPEKCIKAWKVLRSPSVCACVSRLCQVGLHCVDHLLQKSLFSNSHLFTKSAHWSVDNPITHALPAPVRTLMGTRRDKSVSLDPVRSLHTLTQMRCPH